MQQPTSRQLYAYWDRVRNGRVAPRRFEIEPAKIATILPETFIVEDAGMLGYRFRLAGTKICEHFGRELRGADLLDSTPWQLDLQAALGMPRPIYGHLPLVVEPDGAKLSKSARAVPLDPAQVSEGLTSTLTLLSQSPPPDLGRAPVKEVWNWALTHWRPQSLVGRTEVRCPLPATAKQK